jgi:hypothetical protein
MLYSRAREDGRIHASRGIQMARTCRAGAFHFRIQHRFTTWVMPSGLLCRLQRTRIQCASCAIHSWLNASRWRATTKAAQLSMTKAHSRHKRSPQQSMVVSSPRFRAAGMGWSPFAAAGAALRCPRTRRCYADIYCSPARWAPERRHRVRSITCSYILARRHAVMATTARHQASAATVPAQMLSVTRRLLGHC